MYQHKNFLAPNTYKIGGSSKYFSICSSVEDLQQLINLSQNQGYPWFLLGNGSNILISDDGYPGLVIKLGIEFKKVTFGQDSVMVGGGVLLPNMSRHCLAKGWGGFEFMCGIPGTIGGAVRINAGTKQGEIKDHFLTATILSPSGNVYTLTKDDIKFSVRQSKLMTNQDIVLSATFAKPYISERSTILKKIKKIIISRRNNQPKIKRNCGSVFKNPVNGKPAGWYIDQSGLKGFRIGDAMVAHEHANWILNLGNAKAYEVKQIITHIQKTVLERFGILLEREVIYVPEDVI